MSEYKPEDLEREAHLLGAEAEQPTVQAMLRAGAQAMREARAGRQLRNELDIFDTSSTVDIPKLIKAYDTSTKGSTHEVP